MEAGFASGFHFLNRFQTEASAANQGSAEKAPPKASLKTFEDIFALHSYLVVQRLTRFWKQHIDSIVIVSLKVVCNVIQNYASVFYERY